MLTNPRWLNQLNSGIWQTAMGQYTPSLVWTGSAKPNVVGTAASTCANWTSQSATGVLGWGAYDNVESWNASLAPMACNQTYTLYCVEP